MTNFFVIMGLGGVTAGIAPPSHFGGTPASVFASGPSLEMSLGASTRPALSATAALPSKNPSIIWDFRGQTGLGHASGSPGVWLSPPSRDPAKMRFGARMGVSAGTGDLGWLMPWDNPFIGPTMHLQLSREDARWARSWTLGVEQLHPFRGDSHPDYSVWSPDYECVQRGRFCYPVASRVGHWYSIDARAVRKFEGADLVIGAALHVAPFVKYLDPVLTVGTRW